MELFYNSDYFIFSKDHYTLWFNRNFDAKPLFKNDVNVNAIPNLTCLGIVYGLIGKFRKNNILVIKQRQFVGILPGVAGREDKVFKIKRILILNLNDEDSNLTDLSLDYCHLHKSNSSNDSQVNHYNKTTLDNNLSSKLQTTGSGIQKTWNTIKVSCNVNSGRSFGISLQPNTEHTKDRRFFSEILKLFDNSDSFYYSYSGDLSNSLQKKSQQSLISPKSGDFWSNYDDRFIWNKFMINSLLENCDSFHSIPNLTYWIVPIIQGFFQLDTCSLGIEQEDGISSSLNELHFILISRRSRFRQGTRYKKRGLDEDGNCANYVETEQIFKYGNHVVSFSQIRGSIPLFWSQSGHSYRPPPKIERSQEENSKAFALHFEKELSIYEKEVIVNLVDKSGREKVIGDAYLDHIIHLNSPKLIYISFDFHEHCRGMKFENISILMAYLNDIIQDMKYCWIDERGIIQVQNGIFRVNCVDCLDRTNIVQTAIARAVMDYQFSKLGIFSPKNEISPNCKRVFQLMWANNGDTLSRQYTGTNALKSDYTRTGERRLSGVVKDSYNSASRYYQNQFKDAYRQAVIDVLQGNPINDSDLSSPDSDTLGEEDDIEYHERIKQVIEDCKKILIPENEIVLGAWPLIDADLMHQGPNSSLLQDMDRILILTKDFYYVAEYDDQTDRITKYQRVFLEDLEKIEFGPEPSAQLFFTSITRYHKPSYCIRFHYSLNGQSGYFHMFRPTNTRFFNNMAIPVRTPQDAIDSLKAICESFKVALSVRLLNVPLYEGKLERRKSKVLPFINKPSNISYKKRFYPTSIKSGLLSRNISDNNLLNLKQVGSKAFTNVSSQIAKFKGKLRKNTQSNPQLTNLVSFNENQNKMTSSLSKTSFESIESTDEDEFDGKWEGDEEWSEDESIRALRKNRVSKNQQTSLTSNSSYLLNDLKTSSDISECSDFNDFEESVIPVIPNPSYHLPDFANDTLLESCGILTISSIKRGSDNSDKKQAIKVKDKLSKLAYEHIDDFVLDVMNKATLRQIHRKASESMNSLISKKEFFSSNPKIQRIPNVSSTPDLINQNVKNLSKSSQDIETSNILEMNKQISQLSYENSASCAAIPLIQKDVTGGETIEKYKSNDLHVSAKIKPSHSETVIGQEKNVNLNLKLRNSFATSLFTEDLILSPLSRIAKGVHNINVNLRSDQFHFTSTTSKQGSLENIDSESLKKTLTKTKIIEI